MKTMDIEDVMVWAFRRECVDAFMAAAKAGLGGADALSGWSAIARFAALGTVVDGGGAAAAELRRQSFDCHPDAILVYETLHTPKGFDDRVRVALTIHAKAGTRPDWHVEQVEEPEIGANGRPRLTTRLHPVTGRPVSVPLVRRIPPDSVVEAARQDWRDWRFGLDMMAAALRGALSSIDVTGPAAPSEPWA